MNKGAHVKPLDRQHAVVDTFSVYFLRVRCIQSHIHTYIFTYIHVFWQPRTCSMRSTLEHPHSTWRYTCIYAYTHTHTCILSMQKRWWSTWMYAYTHTHTCIPSMQEHPHSTWWHVSMYICIHTHTHVHSVHAGTSTQYLNVCIYAYKYTHTHSFYAVMSRNVCMHVHICIHTYARI